MMREIVFDASLDSVLQDRACNKCREHKLKCDRRVPCATCRKKATVCVYGKTSTSNRKRRRTDTYDNYSSATDDNASAAIAPAEHTLQQEPNLDTLDSRQRLIASEQVANISYTGDEQSSLHAWTGDQIINIFDYADLWHDTGISGNIDIDFNFFAESASSDTFWPASISLQLVERLIDTYIAQINPSLPVIKATFLKHGVDQGRYLRERDFAACLLAVCAFICLQSHAATRSAALAKQFLTEAVTLYNTVNLGESPSVETVLACFLIFGSLWTLGMDSAAWLRLQEVMNLARLLKIDRLPITEADEHWQSKMQLYLGLVVVERAFAAGKDHKLLLPKPDKTHFEVFASASITWESEEQRNAAALRIMARSFGQLNDEVLICWRNKCENRVRPGTCDKLSRRSIARILQSFPGPGDHDWTLVMRPSSQTLDSPTGCEVATNERGDVLLTALWLQNRFWHLALTHGLLSANDSCRQLHFDYVSILAREALDVCKNFRIASFECHGQGLAEKLFDIASDHLGIMRCLNGSANMHDEFPDNTEEVLPPGPPIVREVNETSDTPMTILSPDTPGAEGSTTKKQSTPSDFEIATGLLGFLAIFNNGQHSKFKQYFTKYSAFVANASARGG